MRHVSLVAAIVSLVLFTLGCGDESKTSTPVAKKSSSQGSSDGASGGMGGGGGGGMGPPGGMGDPGGGGMGDMMGGMGGGGGMGDPGGGMGDPGGGMGDMMAGMGDPGGGPPGEGGAGDMAEMMGSEGGFPGGGGDPAAGGFPGAGGDMAEAGGFPGAGGDPAGGGAGFPGAGGGDMAEAGGFPGAGGDPAGGGAGFPGGGQGQTTQREPPTMVEIGQGLVSQGRFEDGMKFIHAAVLLGDSDADEVLAKYRWVNGLKRPTLAVRWGMAIQLIEPPKFSGKYYPFGEEQKLDGSLANRGGGNGSGFPGGGDAGGFPGGGDAGGFPGGGDAGGFPGGGAGFGGSGGGSGGNQELTKLAGDLGDIVMDRIKARTERDYYGELFNSTAPSGRRQGGAGGTGGGFPGAGDPAGGGGFPGAGDPAGGGGFPGAGDPAGGGGFPGAGDPAGGGGFPGGGDPAGGGGFPGGGGGDPGAMFGAGGSGRSGGSTSSSLTMLGKGVFKELIGKARAQGLDVVLYFNIKVSKSTRTGLVTNTATIDVVDVSTEQKVFSLAPLNNLKMQKEREAAKKGGRDDPLELAVDKLFEFADRQYRMLPVPQKTTDEVLESRIRPLVASRPENPLSALAEIKFLFSKEMVKKEHVPIAFEQLLGKELSDQWMSADSEARNELLARWLPRTSSGRGGNRGGGGAEPKPFR